MRFKKYLTEAIIIPNKKELQIIKKTLETHIKKAWKTQKDIDFKKIGDDITKKIKDLEIEFLPKKNPNKSGSARPGTPKHHMKIFWSKDIYGYGNIEDIINEWIPNLMVSVEHELVHIEQYRKLEKASPEECGRILNRIHNKYLDKGLDVYLSNAMEVMAHAKGVDKEFQTIGFSGQEVIDMLKNDEGLDELSMESSAFDDYYTQIQGKFPKVWKKFIKYLVMFSQKRK